MKLTTKLDVEAPLDFVYGYLSDFDQFERLAARRGAKVELEGPEGVGRVWTIRFKAKGKQRNVKLQLTHLVAEAVIGLALDSTLFSGVSQIDMVRLGAAKTRLVMGVEFKPKTLGARIFIQSLKLARGRVQKRLDKRAGKLGKMIEGQWRALV